MNLRNSAQHALLVKKTCIICEALEGTVAGWSGGAFCGGVGQAVSAGWRFIAWPKAMNAHEDAEVMVALPFHISQYLSALWDEAAALVELVAPFYRRLSWRICTGEFPLSSGICGSCGIDSPPHGPRVLSVCSPHHREGLGGRPEMVRSQSVAPRVVRRLLFGFAVSESAGGGGAWLSGALSKWCESIGVSSSHETKSAALKHDAKTRIEGGCVSPKACG
ncbi:hypothetical protein TcBrA4_0069760 [Trypanosoma cruzi]|nr:hypothetical protein TcBrA4_0069760 [Trypanosoma cruzi]